MMGKPLSVLPIPLHTKQEQMAHMNNKQINLKGKVWCRQVEQGRSIGLLRGRGHEWFLGPKDGFSESVIFGIYSYLSPSGISIMTITLNRSSGEFAHKQRQQNSIQIQAPGCFVMSSRHLKFLLPREAEGAMFKAGLFYQA